MVKVTVPSAAEVASKWAAVTPGRSAYYEAGASVAGSKWETNAKAASGTFQAAVTAGGIGQRFKGGVGRAGAAKYERKVKAVGVARFSAGIPAAEEDMASGVAPFLDTIAATDIPARKPRGDPGNIERVRALATALYKKRLAVLGAGGASS